MATRWLFLPVMSPAAPSRLILPGARGRPAPGSALSGFRQERMGLPGLVAPALTAAAGFAPPGIFQR